jgi:hypothetical protein
MIKVESGLRMVVFPSARTKNKSESLCVLTKKPPSNDRAAAKYGRNIKASKKHYFGGT